MRRPDAGARKTDFSPIETLQPFPDWHVPVGVGLVGADVMKFSAYSEKPETIGKIGMVQRVHQPLYKISIGVRGAFMEPNRK